MLGIHDLPLFILSGLLLSMLPGPDSLLVMARSAGQGWRAGCAAAFGIGAGTMVHIFCAAIGLSAVLCSPTAFTAIKYVGAAYIFYTALSLLRSAPSSASTTGCPPPLRYRRIVAQGFLTDVFNPKAALFFITLVPQFITSGAPSKPTAFLILGVIFNINGIIWYATLALFTAKVGSRFQTTVHFARWLPRATAGFFIWISFRMALASPQ